MNRGVLYIVWGDKIEAVLQRSIATVKHWHPELPIHVHRIKGGGSLRDKTKMWAITPFESTLYLDADTFVMGRLDYAFDKAEQFGLACSICEAPWMRRYQNNPGIATDAIEYNTGVLFFTGECEAVKHWERWSDMPSKSLWTTLDGKPRGLEYDDQASFAAAVISSGINPYVLPINYNFRPGFHRSFFAPMKIWHDYSWPNVQLAGVNARIEAGAQPITYITL